MLFAQKVGHAQPRPRFVTIPSNFGEGAKWGTMAIKGVFLTLIQSANWGDRRASGGRIVRRGQLLTSYNRIAKICRVSRSFAQKAIRILRECGEVAVESTSQYSVVTIMDFERFQGAPINAGGVHEKASYPLNDSKQLTQGGYTRKHHNNNNKNNKNSLLNPYYLKKRDSYLFGKEKVLKIMRAGEDRLEVAEKKARAQLTEFERGWFEKNGGLKRLKHTDYATLNGIIGRGIAEAKYTYRKKLDKRSLDY